MRREREKMPAISIAPRRDPYIGQRARGYVVSRLLGVGGIGRVYVAHDPLRPGREVAIKVLRPDAAARPGVAERFRLEGRAVAAIEHPRVIRVLGDGRFADGAHWIMMERLIGHDVRTLVHRRGPLPLPTALSLLAQACDGLHAVHRRGIVHCDLKPDHLFVQEPGEDVKIVDFGAAAIVDAALAGSVGPETDQVMGSAGFMAPEQACGHPVDRRADVFSLGAVAYWMLSAQLPFEGRTIADYTLSVMSDPPADVRVWRADVPASWAEAIARALSPDPAQRPQTALELARALLGVPGADDLVRMVAPDVLRDASLAETAKQRPITRRGVAAISPARG